MNYLLDTHVFLWIVGKADQIKPDAADVIRDPRNVILVSAVSGVEVAIKRALGKLEAPRDLEEEVELRGFNHLPLSYHHSNALAELPMIHQDPFDRMLIGQAIYENLTIITHDRKFESYDVKVLWT